jgi:hypothetical protein
MWKTFWHEFRTLSIGQKSLFAAVIGSSLFLFGFHEHGTTNELPPAVDCSLISKAKTVTITMNDVTVEPKNTRITVCDTLKIVNQGTDYQQPALGAHPNHFEYPGYEAEVLIAPGESFSVQIVHTGRFLIHDHLKESTQGFVAVKARNQ